VIAIIDYGMGNLRSVANAFEALGRNVMISTRAETLREAERVVLPGVGAFGDGIRNLRDGGWVDVLEEEVLGNQKPFIGICLGMQLLATTSFEHGRHGGLNWISGTVQRFSDDDVRGPLIGWCDVNVCKEFGLLEGLGEHPAFYFVHSYHLVPDSSDVITSTCAYGIEFVATVQKENVFGTQFHPEKSHKAGLALLKNFVNYRA
jgi:glutamine amidotransferase